MAPLGNDRWRGAFTVPAPGRYRYAVTAWVDALLSWRRDYARRRDRTKRGGDAILVSLVEAANVPSPERADMLALDDALQRLEALDPRKGRIVEMRFFGGLSLEETAEALNVSVATVRRDWSLARTWLFRELKTRHE
jgi:RNA polymerase sigma factor (TIGR02999 family)